jgi:hypothetical protein
METKKFYPLHRLFSKEIKAESPALAKCDSITEASRIRFGVKGMTRFVHVTPEMRAAIVAFFGTNHSDMLAWANLAKIECREDEETERYDKNYRVIKLKRPVPYVDVRADDFNALPEHRSAYKAMVKTFGLPFVVRLVAHRDFKDVAKGYEFLKADKKRWARFEKDIIGAFHLFPESMHFHMVHDYALKKMKDQERSLRPRQPRQSKNSFSEADRNLPDFDLPAEIGKFKIMVPKTDADLRAIGTAQNHCVGARGMGYGSQIIAGNISIVALYRKSLADGICVEIDLNRLDVIQAQGKGRREPKEPENKAIQEIVSKLKTTIQRL